MPALFVQSNGTALVPFGPLDIESIAALPRGIPLSVRVTNLTRSDKQNRRMWAMLHDISRAQPEGRQWPPETWKAAFMHALGCEILWQPGIEGGPPFPAGFRSSQLTKAQMAALIDFIEAYGARHNVRWAIA